MQLVFILVLAWLTGVPGSAVASLQQDPRSASSSPSRAQEEGAQSLPKKGGAPATEQGASDSAAKKAANAPAPSPAKRHRRRKNARKPAPVGDPHKIVVREGGAVAPPAQIVPGLAPQEAGQQRQNTVELLRVTDQNLKQLTAHTLDSRQQETVTQIHNYVDGARSALKDGDTQRAHTLALKAHLLADDLVKH